MAVLHFQQAVEQHHQWLENVKAFLNGEACQLDLNKIVQDDQCVIGQWLHGEGSRFQHIDEFQTVKALHKKIHILAGQARDAYIDKEYDRVEGLMNQLDKVKHVMFMTWSDLNAIIGNLE